MRILYISHLYHPEPGAQPARVSALARRWVRSGHTVTVLTGFPNHPHGRLYPGYRGRYARLVATENDEGVRVVRTWLLPRPNRGAINRLLVFSTFTASAALTSLFLRPFDVVIGTVPQPLAPLAAWLRSRLGRARFVLEVRDLWPEGLLATGQANRGSLSYRSLDRVARFLHARADHVVAVTNAIRDHVVVERGVPPERIDVVPAGVDARAFSTAGRVDNAKQEWGVTGRFVVSYVGTLGNAHGLEVVLEAAARVKASEPRMLFLFAGTGAEEDALQARARALSLDNVRFLGQQPRVAIPSILAASDVCLATLRDDPLFRTATPTKLYEYMAAARPAVCNVPGEASDLLERAGAGVSIAPGDPAALADAVTALAADPGRRKAMGQAGRRFVETTASWEQRAAAYIEVLKRAVERGPRNA